MNVVDYIKKEIDIFTLLKSIGANKISNQSHEIRCSCPIHQGDNPTAFVYNKSNQLWYCHTSDCGGGDIISLIEKKYDCSFIEAISYIKDIFNLNTDGMVLKRTENNFDKLKAWIEKNKAKLNKNTNELFDINSLGKLYELNSYRQFDSEILAKHNVKYSDELKKIVIPIYEEEQMIGVTMRTTNNTEPKWKHLPKGIKTNQLLYNIDNIIEGEPIILVEGPWDVINMEMYEFKNSVCTFGCHLSKEQYMKLFKITTEIVILYDNDSAGEKGTKQIIDNYKNMFNIYIPTTKPKTDIGDCTLEELNEILKSLRRI
jgi:DNA primase